MNKNPWLQFYTGDWLTDLDEHPLEMEGAWIRIICKMHRCDCDGTLTKSLDQWSRILRVSEADTERILTYLSSHGICDMSRIGHANFTVMSRRMIRDSKIREQNRLRKQKQRSHAHVTGEKLESESEDIKKKDTLSRSLDAQAEDVLTYLNEKMNKHFTVCTSSLKHIKARLREKHTIEELKQIIDTKVCDPFFIENKKYRRPSTLFSNEHFAEYLEESPEDYQQKPQPKPEYEWKP